MWWRREPERTYCDQATISEVGGDAERVQRQLCSTQSHRRTLFNGSASVQSDVGQDSAGSHLFPSGWVTRKSTSPHIAFPLRYEPVTSHHTCQLTSKNLLHKPGNPKLRVFEDCGAYLRTTQGNMASEPHSCLHHVLRDDLKIVITWRNLLARLPSLLLSRHQRTSSETSQPAFR
jgi:hypothetical protein